jgi:hypothetical protein
LTILDYFDFGSIISSIVPATFGLLMFNKLNKTLRFLSVFCIVFCIVDLVFSILGKNGIHNIFIMHLTTPVEFAMILHLFVLIAFNKSKILLEFVAIIIFVIICSFNTYYLQSINVPNSLARGTEAVVIITLCVNFYYQIFKSDQNINLIQYPYFWLVSGFLIYFSGTLFLFVVTNNKEFNITYPAIHSVLYIILNLVYTYVLWLGSRKSIS